MADDLVPRSPRRFLKQKKESAKAKQRRPANGPTPHELASVPSANIGAKGLSPRSNAKPRLRSSYRQVHVPGDEHEEAVSSHKAFKHSLSGVFAKSQQFVTSGNHFADAAEQLGHELLTAAKSEWAHAEESTDQYVADIAKKMKTIATLQRRLLDEVAEALDQPIFQTLDVDFLAMQRAKQRLERLQAKVKKPRDVDEDPADVKAKLEAARAEYDGLVRTMEFNKRTKLFRYMHSVMQTQVAFFTRGHKLLDPVSVKLATLEVKLSEMESQRADGMDGFLMKQKSDDKWQKVWVVLDEGWLAVHKEDRKKKPDRMNMLISTVRLPRASTRPTDKHFVFELVTPDRKKPWVLAAKSEAERDQWIAAIQASIGNLINNHQESSPSSTDGGDDAKRHRRQKKRAKPKLVPQLDTSPRPAVSALQRLADVPGNNVCVDCGAEDPDWASINLGVLICLDCSGVHRSLGSHITKVRSTTMDKWPSFTVEYVRLIGNITANKFWEACLGETKKPHFAKTDREEREKFISAKYRERKFLPESEMTKEQCVEAFHSLCSADAISLKEGADEAPLIELYQLLGYGVEVDERLDGSSVLQKAITNGNPELLHILMVNGADGSVIDPDTGDNLLHFCAMEGQGDCLRVLFDFGVGRGGDLTALNNDGKKPADAAMANSKVETLLKEAELSWSKSGDLALSAQDIANPRRSPRERLIFRKSHGKLHRRGHSLFTRETPLQIEEISLPTTHSEEDGDHEEEDQQSPPQQLIPKDPRWANLQKLGKNLEVGGKIEDHSDSESNSFAEDVLM